MKICFKNLAMKKYKFDDIVESEEEHYSSNDIFNDIDNEYADGETLRM